MSTINLPKNVVKKMLAAIECSQAMDMPNTEGQHVLTHYGWDREMKFEVHASKFISNLQSEAIAEARNAGV